MRFTWATTKPSAAPKSGKTILPSYSPELSPEERLNSDLKQAMGKRVPVRTNAKLRNAANGHMAMLERSPERVRRCVQDQRGKYAA